MNATRTCTLCVLLLPALLSLAPLVHGDEETHETYRDFARTGKYLLYVSRKEQRKARIYHSPRAGGFLVLDSDFEKPFLILPRDDKVLSVDPGDVVNVSDKSADLKKGAEPEELGEIRLEGRDVLINVKGELVARLVPRPYLIGEATAEEVLVHSPEYERDVADYRPDAEDLQKLVDCAEETEIVVFYGTWCPTCRRLIPRILRVDQEIEGSKIKIVYYGLPRGGALRSEPEARKAGITRVPTGIMRVDGKVVGKISSRDLSRPEAALCRVIARNQ